MASISAPDTICTTHYTDSSQQPFPARERSDDTDDEAQPGVPERSLILEHQCSEASDCSDKDRAKLLVGTRLTDFQIPRLDSYENQVC